MKYDDGCLSDGAARGWVNPARPEGHAEVLPAAARLLDRPGHVPRLVALDVKAILTPPCIFN